MCDVTESFALLTDLCRNGQTVTAEQVDGMERNVMRGNRSDLDLGYCARLRMIAGWLRSGVVCRCGSDDVAKTGLGDFPRGCGRCGTSIRQDPTGEPHYVSPRTMRKAQAAFDSVGDAFDE